MFCPQCGSNIEEGAKFCSKCGTAVNTSSLSNTPTTTGAFSGITPEPEVQKRKNTTITKTIIIVSIIFVLLAIILANLTRQRHILPDGEWLDIIGIIGVVAIITSVVIAIIHIIRKAIKDKNNL
jgi:uncharacterized membrane protein YvbJ